MEGTEPEEGEAYCYKEDEDGTSIDPDNDFSYLDVKLENALGHFQKDFEGGVSAENLGAKFGGYGSFLPAHQRSPSIWSHPKSPWRFQNHSEPSSFDNRHVEGASQNYTAPSSVPLSVGLGAASCNTSLLHSSMFPSGDVVVKRDSCLPSDHVAGQFPLKQETSRQSINPTDQRALKVRIKVGSDNTSRKNAAIYSGLGLDNSPSSSLGKSPGESGGTQLEFQAALNESPSSILQIMTSFPVPGGILLSPLDDSLLCLARKEALGRKSKPAADLKGSEEHTALSVDESACMLGNGKVLKQNKMKLVGKGERLLAFKHGNGMKIENDMKSLLKEKIDNKTPESKECFSNDVKPVPLSTSTFDIGDSVKGTCWALEASKKANKDGVKGRSISSDPAKEESLESISGQDSGNSEKQKAGGSSLGQIWEHTVANSHKADSLDSGENGRSEDDKISAPFKANSHVSQCKEGHKVRATGALKQKVVQKIASHKQDEVKMPCRTEKSLSEGKIKSKGSQSNGRLATDLEGESLGFGFSAAPKDAKNSSYGVHSCKSKVKNLKSQKGISKVRDKQRDSLGDARSKGTDNQMVLLQRPSGDRSKDSDHEDVEKELKAYLDKSKERLHGKNGDKKLTSEGTVKEAPNAGTPFTREEPISEMTPAAVPAIVIEENWVCCDSCEKWRLLPFGIMPEQLPEKWICSMLNWLPGMNRCDINEEETTKALNALYRVPVPESQNGVPNHANGIALGVTSADAQQLDQNHHNLSSHAMLNRGKKKHGSKEIPKNQRQESAKSRSLYDMSQSHLESNLRNKSSFQHLNGSHNLAKEKHVHKPKAKQIDGVDAKQTMVKNKREADQFVDGASKKTKIEGMHHTNKNWNSEYDRNIVRVGLSLSSGLPTKTSGKDMQQCNEYSYSKNAKADAKERLLGKKREDQAHISLNGAPVHMETCDKTDISLKKRKLKDWHDNQMYGETFHRAGHHIPGTIVSDKEESSESEYRKERKCRLSKMEGKESRTSRGGDRSNRKGRVAQISVSGGVDHSFDGMEEVKSIKKGEQLKKHGKILSQRTTDGLHSLKRDLGSRQASTLATSSSSMVSGSRKSRASFQEASSPVESVSSSPFRTSNLDSCTPARREISGKVDATNGALPLMDTGPRRYSDVEGKVESNQFGAAGKKKVSCVFRTESLDCQDKDGNQKFSSTAKSNIEPSSENRNSDLVNGDGCTLQQHGWDSDDLHSMENCYSEDRLNKNHSRENVLFPQKAVLDCSLWSKYRDRSSMSDYGGDKLSVSDPLGEQEEMYPQKSLKYDSETDPHHLAPFCETVSDASHSVPDQCRINCIKDERNHVGENVSLGKWSNDSRKENQLKLGERDGSDVKLGALVSANGKFTLPHNLTWKVEGEKFSNRFLGKKTDPMEMESSDGKLQNFLHHEDKQEALAWGCQSILRSQKEGVFDAVSVDTPSNSDVSKVSKRHGYAGNQNGARSRLGPLPPNWHGPRGLNAPSPLRKGSSAQTATDAVKEAKRLQDYADRLKSSGFAFESNEVYFQAALQFLHGASLLEICNSESDKHGEMTQMQMYSVTAEICKSCAHEYERRQEMPAAALAYKCMEVAYMRAVYCKHSSTSRDRHELQATLQMVPHGESPSSSASDIDNLNNQTAVDKAALSKGSSHFAGNHVIAARNGPNFIRLLDFTQHVNFAMEASRKSQNAFAAANEILEDSQNMEGITSVKKVIDFSFQDVGGLVNLVRLAIGAISRSGFSGSRG